MLNLDDLVFVKEGERAMELAVVSEITPFIVRQGRFGNKKHNGVISYTALYSDGEELNFNSSNINRTVFVVK